jgi:hypothetical protein
MTIEKGHSNNNGRNTPRRPIANPRERRLGTDEGKQLLQQTPTPQNKPTREKQQQRLNQDFESMERAASREPEPQPTPLQLIDNTVVHPEEELTHPGAPENFGFTTLTELFPESLIKEINGRIDEFVSSCETIRQELLTDPKALKNGQFIGWDDTYVGDVICRHFKLKNRFLHESDNSLLKNRRRVAGFLFGQGAFEEENKSYIPESVAKAIEFHNAVQRWGVLFAGTTGISFGYLLSHEPLKLVNGYNYKSLRFLAAITVNAVVFGVTTKATEKMVETRLNEEKLNKNNHRLWFILIVLFLKFPLTLFTGVAGSAQNIKPSDLNFIRANAAQTYYDRSQHKAKEYISGADEGSQIYFKLKTLQSDIIPDSEQQTEIKNLTESIDKNQYPSLAALYGEQIYLENRKAYYQGILGKSDNETTKNQRTQAAIYLGQDFSTGKLKQVVGTYQKGVALLKENMEKENISYIEGVRPTNELIEDYEKSTEDLKNMNATEWLTKWLPNIVGGKESKKIISEIDSITIDSLSAVDSINLVYWKLKDESNNGDVLPSFLAYVSIALLFEIVSSLTLAALWNNPEYKKYYTNRQFQDSYKTFVDQFIGKVKERSGANKYEHAETIPPLTSHHGTTDIIVRQLLRERPVTGVILRYDYEKFNPKYKLDKKLAKREADVAAGNDVRHPVVKVISVISEALSRNR